MEKIALPQLAAPAFVPAVAAFRAEAVNPADLLARLQGAFEEFKAKNDEALKAKANADDVVRTEELARINATLSDLQAALDSQARRDAAASIGGAASRAVDAEYTQKFESAMRNPYDMTIQANLTKSPLGDGGVLAPVEWDRSITDKMLLISNLRSIFSVISVGGAGFKKVFNLRGTASGWVSETAARPETNTPTFAEMSLTYGELYAQPAASQQMLDDALVNLENWLANEVASEFARAEGAAFITGDGVDKPTGILTYVTGAANAAANPLGAITLRNGGAASVLGNSDSIVDFVHDLPAMFTANAGFMMNRLTLAAIRKIKDGQGNYLWQPSYQAGQPSTLLGYPVNEVPAMPNIAANAVPILFGDFAMAYNIHDRSGTSVLVDPYINKPYVNFYTRKRVGGACVNTECVKGYRIAT